MPLSPEVLEKYEMVIGLEVHVQLLTKSKIFCGCSTQFGAPANAHTCPVCLALPGALPVLNREAVTMAMKAAMALNCAINPHSRFARKNYFYPDLPKGYQISQYDEPLAEHGSVEIEVNGERKRIGITRVHMEEDAGKSLHEGFPDSDRNSYIDLNRSGVPLIEIVTEPDLRAPEEAHEFVTRLRTMMLYLEVSDCNMEEGSLRCDANASVRLTGAHAFGTKTEVKNLNSFRFLERALAYEKERQIAVIEGGGKVTQETRLWDSREQRTYGMRSKESAHDYRYFPDPTCCRSSSPKPGRPKRGEPCRSFQHNVEIADPLSFPSPSVSCCWNEPGLGKLTCSPPRKCMWSCSRTRNCRRRRMSLRPSATMKSDAAAGHRKTTVKSTNLRL